jgi:hypothetical protein
MSDSTKPLPVLAHDDLDQVTGGTTSSSGSTSDDQINAVLQEIQSSLKDLGARNNNGGNFMNELLPLLLMFRGGFGFGGGGGGGFGCGCGMPSCSHRRW